MIARAGAAIAARLARFAPQHARGTAAAITGSPADRGSGAPAGRRLLLVAATFLLTALVLGAALATAAAPVVTVEDATNVGASVADVEGTVNPEGQYTTWRFQYISDAHYQENLANTLPGFEGASTGPEGSTETAETLERQLTNLNPSTTYHLRLQAENADGQSSAEAASTFTTQSVTAPLVSIDQTSGVTSTSAHLAGHVTPGGSDPAFATDWHFECTPTCPGSLGGHLDADEAGHAVEVDATDLEPNTDYTVKLLASNLGGTSEATESGGESVAFHTSTQLPGVSRPSSTPTGQGEVDLGGFVNPHNSDVTDCRFEFGPDDSYGTSVPCEALPPTANQPQLVRAGLSGLVPGATYHFRLSATSEAGTTESDDATFRVLSAAETSTCPNAGALGVGFLPDCRAWEMVSPPDKNGGGIVFNPYRTRAAADGSAIQFASLAGFADTVGGAVATDYLARRSSDPNPGDNGWATHAITPPQDPNTWSASASGTEPKYEGSFSDDLSTGIFASFTPLTDAPYVAEAFNLYLRDDLLESGSGSYTLLTDSQSPIPGTAATQQGARPFPAGASNDFSHVIYESTFNLAPGSSGGFFFNGLFLAGTKELFEWTGDSVRLVGILPNGNAAPRSHAGSGASVPFGYRTTSHPITADGSRVFFTAPASGGESSGQIYARINGRSTVKLNVNESLVSTAPEPATYWDASADGSRVFFTSGERLTDDSPNQDGSPKLYIWKRANVDEQQSVSVDATGGTFTLAFNGAATEPIAFDASAADVRAALEALRGPSPLEPPLIAPENVTVSGGPTSAGATAPYVVTFTGDLAGADVAEMNADGSALTGGSGTVTITITEPVHNLTYVDNKTDGVLGISEDGHYVYYSARSSLHLWHEGRITTIGKISGLGDLLDGWAPQNIRPKQTQVTPDGRHILFSSRGGGSLLSAHGGVDYDHGECQEIDLGCLELYLYSADNDTLQCASCNPAGSPATTSAHARQLPEASLGLAQIASALLSHPLSEDGRYVFFDSAERLVSEDVNGVSDAYAFDSLTGTVRLLSSGENPKPSFFIDASASGSDAFFATAEALSRWDNDQAYDLYDARRAGGFPEPPPSPPGCQGDACQPLTPALNDPTPASSAFRGSGDPRPARKRKSRCHRRQRNARSGQKKPCRKHATRHRDSSDRGRTGR